MRSAALALSLMLLPLGANAAEMIIKDASTHERAQSLDVVGTLGWAGYFHVGVGGWYGYPVMPDGFLPTVNDSFWIEGGAGIERYSYNYGVINCSVSWMRVNPMAGVRWAFHLTNDWTVFAKARLGYGIGFADSADCGGITYAAPSYSAPLYDGGIGAYWNFSPDWRMRFDLGYWTSVGAGTDL